MGRNYAKLHSNKVVAIANKLVDTWKKHNISEGLIQFWDYFHVYVNRRFILEEIINLLIGKNYVNENTLIRGCRYKKGAEMLKGKSYINGRFTLMGGTLMRGLTVVMCTSLIASMNSQCYLYTKS